MCGIAGLYSFSGAPLPQRSALAAMVGALHHRGPDGSATLVDGPVGLAHARLSIIDLEGGAQPIANEDRSVWVVLNGEIFNHIELRRQLEARGHRFRTRSDTEVLVHLYEEHGEEFLSELNGQFAIALWDSHLQRLLLARDRTGIRPLFYCHRGASFAFASEVKALFQLPEIPRRLNLSGLASLFSYWSVLPPHTVFEGIESLAPGERMVLSAGGLRRQRYWDWQFEPSSNRRSEAECAEELHALLVDAVRLQLRSDVPVGAYLSGGLDSAIITTLIKNHSDTDLRSFSLTFEDAEFDESHHQSLLARHLNTRHSSLVCRQSDIAAAFPRAIWHAESPLVRTGPAPMMLLADSVRLAGYKVVLTGEGADEVFAGYDLFKEAKIRRSMARNPRSVWRGRLLERLYPYLSQSPTASRAFTQAFFADGLDQKDAPWFAHQPRLSTTRRILRYLRPELQTQALAWDPHAALGQVLPADFGTWPPQGRDQYVEAHTLMSGYLLSSQGDRMAMAASIEARYPFLDHRVIEFAGKLPASYKLRALHEKSLLKQSMAAELPPAIVARQKQPYRAPDSDSFFVNGRPVEYVADLLGADRVNAAGIFDAVAVSRLVEKCRSGRARGFGDNMAFVGVLSTMLLHAQFIAPESGPKAWHGG